MGSVLRGNNPQTIPDKTSFPLELFKARRNYVFLLHWKSQRISDVNASLPTLSNFSKIKYINHSPAIH